MKNKISKKNHIPVGNYAKLLLIVIVTVAVCLLLTNLYKNRVNYEHNISIIRETLIREVNADEIYNYVRENEDSIIYIGVVSDDNCRDFEREFNKVIKDKNLGDIITYLNITDVKNKNKFLKEFNKFYDTSLQGYPSLVIFENGCVKSILTVKVGHELNIDQCNKFLDQNGVTSIYYD